MFIDFHTHRPTAEGVITPRSFGIHPWRADEETAMDYNTFIEKYHKAFEDSELIGECGLDKVCNSSWSRQLELFEWQITISEELHKPIVIHCVRALNDLIRIKKERQSRDTIWVVHGFIGGHEMAMQLYNAGIWVSFGAAIIDPRRIKVRDCLSSIATPFLLETDDSLCGIGTIYDVAAQIRGTDVESLSDIIKQHYSTLFGFEPIL